MASPLEKLRITVQFLVKQKSSLVEEITHPADKLLEAAQRIDCIEGKKPWAGTALGSPDLFMGFASGKQQKTENIKMFGKLGS